MSLTERAGRPLLDRSERGARLPAGDAPQGRPVRLQPGHRQQPGHRARLPRARQLHCPVGR